MNIKKIISLLLALAVGCVVPLPTVKAQDLGGALDLPQLGQTLTMSAAIRAQAERDAARLKGHSPRTTKKRLTPRGSTRFRVNLALRQRNLAQFVARVKKTDPHMAASLQKSFAQGDPIAAIAPGLRKYNLRTDDVADATTAYLVSAWYGVRGRNDDPPTAYVRGVRAQMHDVLLSTPAFTSASNATKQQMAESLLVYTMVNDALITAAKGKPAQMAKVKTAIGQGARNSFRLDLATIKLTANGLRL